MDDTERIAVLSWARDVAVGLIDEPDFARDMADGGYAEEAKCYADKPKSEWPCGVLILMGSHEEHHPECPKSQDWRD